MNLQNFEQHIPSTILQRGKQNYENGAVLYVDESEVGIWTAEVEGTEVYSVEVTMEDTVEVAAVFCDCPFEGDVCKHIVSVLYTLRAELKVSAGKPAKKTKKLSFSELIGKTSKAELQAFVERYAKNNKDFKSHFELHFAHKDEQIDIEKKYADLVKTTIRSFSDRGYFDYRSTNALAREMDSFLVKSHECIRTENFKDGVTIAKVVLKNLISDVIPSCDDSNGSIGTTIMDSIGLIREVADSDVCSRELKDGIFGFLDTELKNSNYFDYGDFGNELFEMYRTLAVLLGKEREFVLFIDAFVTKELKSTSDNYQYEFFIHQKIQFYRETGDTKRADELTLQNINIVRIRQMAVEKAIQKNDLTLAKTLINEGIQIAEKKANPGTVAQWKLVLLKIAELEGDLERIRYYTFNFAFDRGFNVDYYRRWRKTFSAKEWEVELSELIAQRTATVKKEAKKHETQSWWSIDYNLLLELAPIYVEEQQWDKLFERVKCYPELNTLLKYLPFLSSGFPAEMTDLIIPALLHSGDKASARSHYAQLVSEMKRVLKAIPESRGKILEAVESLKLKYPRRPAMFDEFKKLS